MAADRGAFIDQSQSLNIHMDAPTFGKLTSLHFYTWGKVSASVGSLLLLGVQLMDQSQSLNIHTDAPTFDKLSSLQFCTWGKGLKTGMYYLRTRGAADAIKFTVDAEAAKRSQERRVKEADMQARLAEMTCSLENRDGCVSCGS
ncbi:unnamed protein product [Closterium sp. NIES-54]